MKLILITVFAFVGIIHGQFSELPKCNWDDPDLASCLVDLFEIIRPILKKGIPGLLPSLDPFLIDNIPFEASLPSVRLEVEATNAEARGGLDLKIISFKLDAKRKTADVAVIIPNLIVTADYTADVLKIFNIHTAGTFTGIFYDVNVQIKARGAIAGDNNGPKHLRISDITINVGFGKGSTYHIEITEGGIAAKAATKAANLAPKRLVLYMLRSLINKTAAKMLQKYLDIILEKLPVNLVLQ